MPGNQLSLPSNQGRSQEFAKGEKGDLETEDPQRGPGAEPAET